jgi:hypothetical protein
MKHTTLLVWSLTLCLAAPITLVAAEAQAKQPPRDILGVRLGMTEQQAHRVLQGLGREEGVASKKGKELWEVNHPRIAQVAIKVSRRGDIEWVTAFARRDVRRLRYSDVGDLQKARIAGSYIFEWDVPARGQEPAYRVVARGTDPDYVGSYSIFRPAKGRGRAAAGPTATSPPTAGSR